MRRLPNEFFTELTYATIQKDAMWMEYEEQMEDFSLNQYIDYDVVSNSDVFLCGYFPALNMEMAIIGLQDGDQGLFYHVIRDGSSVPQVEAFSLADRKEDFPVDMLMYAATTQIRLRQNEQSYRDVVAELAQSRSGCGSCSGCK